MAGDETPSSSYTNRSYDIFIFEQQSSSDLYPVAKPSTSLTAFLSTSASTWHQHLGHSGDEVLRSLVSRRFISCNKEKSSHICHACQLGKHVKLPFHSSNSIVEHGCDIIHSNFWTSLIQKYTLQLFERAHMVNCNPSWTPVDTESKLGPDIVLVQDPTLYRSIAGGLQYLTFTGPDLSYAVHQIFLYMYDPREPYLADLNRYCIFFGDNLLSWSAKRHHTLLRSGAEAEYQGVVNVVAETAWLCNLLRELHSPLSTVTLVYCDKVSVVYRSANPGQH
nr:hypothetical protein [Tanacetum cinerariifolium]